MAITTNVLRRAFSSGRRAATVDMHSHFLPRSWPDFAARHGGEQWPWMRTEGPLPAGTFGYERQADAMLMSGARDFRPVTRACWGTLALTPPPHA